MSGEEPSPPPVTPGLRRRLACLVYDGVLLFGVVMLGALAYGVVTQQRHALHGKTGLQVVLFVLLAAYFTGFWSRGGQTLAMKTWHIRLLTRDGRPVGAARALGRFLLSWLWFAPALVWMQAAGVGSGGGVATIFVVGMLTYASLVWLNPQRQYPHDLLAGTRLVHWRPTPRR
jgi:uncharacterized RDD family membrane protein YckC